MIGAQKRANNEGKDGSKEKRGKRKLILKIV
jgi:hypothetical protein